MHVSLKQGIQSKRTHPHLQSFFFDLISSDKAKKAEMKLAMTIELVDAILVKITPTTKFAPDSTGKGR